MAIWLSKGLFGWGLKQQTIATAIFYISLSLISLVMGFVVVSSPESFISDDDKPLQVLAREEDDQLAQEYWYFKLNLTEDAFSHVENRSRERHHFQTLRMHLINEGIEMVLGSLITIVVSGLVIYGIKKVGSSLN
ncbi:hypothetical protein TCAL_15315 [Tigriopus californicus]|uniref:Uncharacterized protein n=1 Tax=Tigriopus californicus TaxID=6832 RepID=A0A553PKN6_TIGCA|nr:hypothetical protein TCAL_15315 [Tigriopus californicus]